MTTKRKLTNKGKVLRKFPNAYWGLLSGNIYRSGYAGDFKILGSHMVAKLAWADAARRLK